MAKKIKTALHFLGMGATILSIMTLIKMTFCVMRLSLIKNEALSITLKNVELSLTF